MIYSFCFWRLTCNSSVFQKLYGEHVTVCLSWILLAGSICIWCMHWLINRMLSKHPGSCWPINWSRSVHLLHFDQYPALGLCGHDLWTFPSHQETCQLFNLPSHFNDTSVLLFYPSWRILWASVLLVSQFAPRYTSSKKILILRFQPPKFFL